MYASRTPTFANDLNEKLSFDTWGDYDAHIPHSPSLSQSHLPPTSPFERRQSALFGSRGGGSPLGRMSPVIDRASIFNHKAPSNTNQGDYPAADPLNPSIARTYSTIGKGGGMIAASQLPGEMTHTDSYKTSDSRPMHASGAELTMVSGDTPGIMDDDGSAAHAGMTCVAFDCHSHQVLQFVP